MNESTTITAVMPEQSAIAATHDAGDADRSAVVQDAPAATASPAGPATTANLPNPADPPMPPVRPDPTPQVQRVRDQEEAQRDQFERKIKSSRIMIVDDEEINVLVVKKYLVTEGYTEFTTTTDSREAISLALSEKPDVILLDVKMPHVTGIDILETAATHPQLAHTPILILTADTDPTLKRKALDLGASDFLTKPVDPNDLIPRVRNSLVVRSHLNQLASQNEVLEQLVRVRTRELTTSRQQLILSLAKAAEKRDNETANHVLRVGAYAAIIAQRLGWSPHAVEMIEQAAQLHDVGKIGVPDSVLFKPGKLEPLEYDLMKVHCAVGHEIIAPMAGDEARTWRAHANYGEAILNNRSSPLLMMASRIAQTHHEHWDGNGYPLGLVGTDIPIEGRITAVADVYDALSTKRPYKKAFSREKCFSILEEGRGTHFDPKILDVFFSASEQIIEVQLAFMDR